MEQRFRTIELSDPAFEKDHLRFITVKTKNLKGRGDVCVFVPPGIEHIGSVPVVLLLHGVYGSAWSWPLKSGVHLLASQMIREGLLPPMVIAMPSDGLWGDGSAYLPHNGYDFEKWIAGDVIFLLKNYIEGVDEKSSFFISGLSMGGFGALQIGAKYGQLFNGITAHSAITRIDQMKLFVEESLDNYEQADKTAEDIFETISRYRKGLPPLRFDCGVDDLLIDYNRELHRKLTGAHIEHEYAEHEGGHEWPYWQAHIKESLLFFASRPGGQL
jgi:enterochelin esterase-like enzyme